MKKKALFNWSGGKDSALALHHTLANQEFEIVTLLTSINKELERISMHGVRKSMLLKQVGAIGLPLTLLELPTGVDMQGYDELMRKTLDPITNQGITHSVFGDIFLEDLKRYKEERMREVGLSGYFPLWKRDTSELLKEFLDTGFKTILVSVDGSKLSKDFVGQELTLELAREFPVGVDPCGENGEFHTYVFEGPIFKEPIEFKKGEIVAKDYTLAKDSTEKVTYWFQDIF